MSHSPQEIDHKEYIRSTHWKKRRRRYYETHERKCAVCGTTEAIELHHHRYDNLYAEQDEDLTPLCQFHHFLVHVFTEAGGFPLEEGLPRLLMFLKLIGIQKLDIGRYV